MKMFLMLTVFLGASAVHADVNSSKTYYQFHSDVFACPSNSGNFIRRGLNAGNLAMHLNGEIAEQAELGHELTNVRKKRDGSCDYTYVRKIPAGKSAKVAFSRNENYFDVQQLPCSTDPGFFGDDSNAKTVNDAIQSEADHNFHFVSPLDSDDEGQCYYVFVRNLEIK